MVYTVNIYKRRMAWNCWCLNDNPIWTSIKESVLQWESGRLAPSPLILVKSFKITGPQFSQWQGRTGCRVSQRPGEWPGVHYLPYSLKWPHFHFLTGNEILINKNKQKKQKASGFERSLVTPSFLGQKRLRVSYYLNYMSVIKLGRKVKLLVISLSCLTPLFEHLRMYWLKYFQIFLHNSRGHHSQ